VYHTTSLIDLAVALQEARRRTLDLVSDLSDTQLMGPHLPIVNPLLWEIGHAAWFQEFWVLRHFRGEPPILADGDRMYDSARVGHDTRWDLPLPSRAGTLEYMQQVLARVIESNELGKRVTAAEHEAYFLILALFHEYMHTEAFTYTRQTLGYSAPRFEAMPARDQGSESQAASSILEPSRRDAAIPGGSFSLGSSASAAFVFDNEQWAHRLNVKPFAISRTAVTNAEFATFVEDAGYRRPELWTKEGWQWRERVDARHPVYWQAASKGGTAGGWLRRNFDQWLPLELDHPVLHVSWYEADAYSCWANRRLPTEAEWEMAASAEPASDGRSLAGRKRTFPWGEAPPSAERANLDWRAMGCLSANALPASDSAFGCRQMIGNVWEWVATDFGPYPGFVAGPYKEYSAPWFGDHKVLRGGCWTTRSSMIRNTYRNFYKPDRRDVFAGFRTCAR
jgi:ergothioneine biosynthesis protein EgtB